LPLLASISSAASAEACEGLAAAMDVAANAAMRAEVRNVDTNGTARSDLLFPGL
jgi:hypothetical protein